MNTSELDRRCFLGGAICLLAVVARGWPRKLIGLRPRRANRTGSSPLLDELRAAMPQTGRVRSLGLACLHAIPWRPIAPCDAGDRLPRAGEIEERLATALGEGAAALRGAELRRRIALRTRNDFRDGRTVCIEGWVLARTEAMLCTVVALA